GGLRMVKKVAGAREGSDKQGTATPDSILNCRCLSVGILACFGASLQFVFLPEIAAKDVLALHLKLHIVRNVGHELDVILSGAEEFIQAVVWLHHSHVAVIAEIAGQPLTD